MLFSTCGLYNILAFINNLLLVNSKGETVELRKVKVPYQNQPSHALGHSVSKTNVYASKMDGFFFFGIACLSFCLFVLDLTLIFDIKARRNLQRDCFKTPI